MNRWSRIIASAILLGLIVAAANYFYQAQRYSQFSKVLGERYEITSEIKEFNKKTGEWPKSVADLSPNPKFAGWSLELLSEDHDRARFRVKKGQHEREITVTGQPSTNAANKE